MMIRIYVAVLRLQYLGFGAVGVRLPERLMVATSPAGLLTSRGRIIAIALQKSVDAGLLGGGRLGKVGGAPHSVRLFQFEL